MNRRFLSMCGVIAPALFVFAIILGGAIRPGYSHISDTVNGLFSPGSPNKFLLDTLHTIYALLLALFGVGLLQLVRRSKQSHPVCIAPVSNLTLLKKEKKMNTKRLSFAVLALMLLLIILTVSFASAQEGQPPRESNAPEAAQAGSNYIPIQGRLTDSSGHPLSGDYSLRFRLYDSATGGTALCEDSRAVKVDQGLFSSYMRAEGCPIDGRTLFLGVEVGSDGEMTPRQFVDNVPYAWSLRPEAKVEASSSSSILYLNNLGSGVGLWGASVSGAGVHGASGLSAGVEGYSLNGPGVYAESLSGVAIAANGKITSTEPTYLWISGNSVRPFHQSDSTIIDMNTTGGATIYRGASTGSKNVMLPITIPGALYGQNVRVTDLDLYWVGATQFDVITAVLMRRQTGVCATSSCYQTILFDTTDRVCDVATDPTGCVLHYDLTTNNVLSVSSGVLYLTIELGFNGPASPIDFGGARLTLEYDD